MRERIEEEEEEEEEDHGDEMRQDETAWDGTGRDEWSDGTSTVDKKNLILRADR